MPDATSQRASFLEVEGDRYFERNQDALRDWRQAAAGDPVLAQLREIGVRPASVLEVGCSNGWRLRALAEMHEGARLCGIDPSAKAVEEGKGAFPDLDLQRGSADDLPFDADSFDLVIFGFCLYLCDRRDLFRIAAEADRVLRDGGVLVTFDFFTEHPRRTPYHHREGVYAYKIDYAQMFLWNPAYRCLASHVHWHGAGEQPDPADRLLVTSLRKGVGEGDAEEAPTS